MEIKNEGTSSPINTHSIISLVLGVITILFFCTGWLPIPFSGFICFPGSGLFGFLALIFGVVALNRIRKHNHGGRPLAWMGITIGGLVFICMLCMLVLIISLFIFAPNQMQPFLNNYRL